MSPRPALAGLVSAAALAAPASAHVAASATASALEPVRAPAFGVPLEGPLESWFGHRWGRRHSGIDIAVLGTDEVRAPLAGLVIFAGRSPARYAGYGTIVRVRHEGGLTTLYAHLARATVKKGDRVEHGALLGHAGCTGSCTGRHLHFEVRRRGKLVNPLRFLAAWVRPLEWPTQGG